MFFDVMYSTTEFKRKVFVLSVKVFSPYNNEWINTSSFMDRKFGLTTVTFCRRDCLSFLKFEQWRKQRIVDSIAFSQIQIGFSESRKL